MLNSELGLELYVCELCEFPEVSIGKFRKSYLLCAEEELLKLEPLGELLEIFDMASCIGIFSTAANAVALLRRSRCSQSYEVAR